MNSLTPKSLVQLERISPSRYTSLKACAYRVVLSNTYGSPLLPYAQHGHFGNIVHEAIKSVLTKEVTTVEEFNEKWQELVAVEESKLVDLGFDFMVPLKKSMIKGYTLKKMQIRSLLNRPERVHENVGVMISYENEVWLESPDGAIAGRADLITTIDSFVRITDFKSGKILADEGDIKQDYEDQLKLYAYLYYSINDCFPDELVIVDLDRNVHQIEFTDEEIIATGAEATALLAQTNVKIDQANSQGLSNPSTNNCTFCLYRPACEYHWELPLDSDQVYVNLKGILVGVRIFRNGSVNVTLSINNTSIVVSNIPEIEAELLTNKLNSSISIYNLFRTDNEMWYKAGRTTVIYEG